ncbi:MAG: hypothetical protein U5N26_01575 [Candidatus Marinimicrobia bacterium]|nr:hypothetical protein [Candidatus Neomarinimicrobiota bacterium]
MSINFDSSKPIYLQLADQEIRQSIMAGDLRGRRGRPFPSASCPPNTGSIRQTIFNATQLLVNEGLLEKRRGRGYFVTGLARGTLKESGVRQFEDERVPELVRQAKMLNISEAQLSELNKENIITNPKRSLS